MLGTNRVRNKTLYDDGKYIIERSWYYEASVITDDHDYAHHVITIWRVWERVEMTSAIDGETFIGRKTIRRIRDITYADCNAKRRRQITIKNRKKLLTWLYHHKDIMSNDQTDVRCYNVDGLGTFCYQFNPADNTCAIQPTPYGFSQSFPPKYRPCPRSFVCDLRPSIGLPGARDKYGNTLRYYFDCAKKRKERFNK